MTKQGHGKTEIPLSAPELVDHVKTRISYMILTYKPFQLLIKQMNFKNPLDFF